MISDMPLPTIPPSLSQFLHLSGTSSSQSTSSAPATTTSSSTSYGATSTDVSRAPQQTPPAQPNAWDSMRDTTHRAIIASGIVSFIILLIFCLWFLKHRRRRAQGPPPGSQPGMLPLYNMHAPANPSSGRGAPNGGGGDAPPSYEEVVPPHLRVATGPPRILHRGEGEDDGVVADGKTPLSEIPFEDVMLEPSSSASSSSSANQAFQDVHHNGLGDTRGHTNS